MRFWPIFDPFLVLKRPIFKAFSDFPWPLTRHHGLKTGQKHRFENPKSFGNYFEKNLFFALGTLVDPPPLALAGRGLGCPPAAPSDHRYVHLGVSLGDSEASKPQKVGGCGWTKCPRNWDLSHVVQDTVHVWFRGVGAHCADFGVFWRLFGPFLGHIVELKGTRVLFDTAKSGRTSSVLTVFCRLGVLPGFRCYFGRKMAVFGPKLRRFGRAPPNLAPTPRPTIGEFLAQNMHWARAPPRL